MWDGINLLKVAWDNAHYRRQLEKEEVKAFRDQSWYRILSRELKKAYRWSNPFSLSRQGRRHLNLPAEDLIFGEITPSTAWLLLKQLGIDQADHVVELGAGRALFSLTAALAYGCQASALEIIPTFTLRTNQIAINLGLKKLTAYTANVLIDPLPSGSVYYLSATTFRATSWRTLNSKLQNVDPGTRAISLSQPLELKYWTIEEELKLPFSWGITTVYLQQRHPNPNNDA